MNEQEIKERNESYKKMYPLGTVLWHMSGIYRGGKVYWAPQARSIEQHCETGGFMFDAAPMVHGNSWGNIGKNYFTSREECLASWGDKPLIADDTRPVAEQEHPDPKEYGKGVIWRDDGVSIVLISVGFSRSLFSLFNLTWNRDKDSEGMTGCGDWLTLDEIRDQIRAKIADRVIEVRVESHLSGVIHQTGNYNNDLWHKHGTTRGYA